MSLIKIQFGIKFCQNDLNEVLDKYWDDSINVSYKEVIFDLSLTEWISTEEIAFLFGWIRTINQLEKKVTVFLPYSYNINSSDLYTKVELIHFKEKYQFEENDQRIKRRKNRNLFLLSVWGMLIRIGIKDTQFKNIIESYNYKQDIVKAKFSHQVIPFTVIDTSSSGGDLQFDREYEDVLEGSKSKNRISKSEGLFDLEVEIVEKLKTYACYSPFESKIISNIITQELYANASQHSQAKEKKNFENECYFTSALNNRWDNPNTINFVEQFIIEKYPETLDFYKDKNRVLKALKLDIVKVNPDLVKKFNERREANLDKYKTEFKNISYLEFTFLDFGVGIHSTLELEFQNAKNSQLKEELSVGYEKKHLHTQILEYAFLMDSSRIPFDQSIDDYNFIARGLYFLIDMVRRFNGLIIARSGYGQVIYDFSERIYISKNKTENIDATIDSIYEVRDSIKLNCYEENISFFPGTMISIVLPEKQKEDLKLSPVRIDDKSLSQYIYKSQIRKFDPAINPLEEFSTNSYEYVSLVFLYEKVLNAISYDELNSTKIIYNKLFAEFVKSLNALKAKNCLVFIDFGFLPMRHIFLKFLYYLTNTPKINEYTKAVIFNLDEVDEKIIQICKTNLRKKANQPFIYRPIPCLRINNSVGIKIEKNILQISWIGVRNEEDEIWLSRLLIGDKESYDVSRFIETDSIEGNFFIKSDERIYSLFNDLNNLKAEFESAKERFVENFLIDLIEDGEVPKHPEKGQYIFLTSKGTYQSKYLSLYESLHNKYLAKFFAKYLLDKYINKSKNEKGEIDYQKLIFQKIITVTVSSQLIGVAIRDLIKENDNYKFLRKGDQSQLLVNCPELIILSSYYSFNTEKPFRKVNPKDNIIIVNDVISTGSLVYRLIDRLTDKEANIQAVMSIADGRIKDADLIESDEVPSIFNESYEESRFIKLISHSDRFQLRKYSEKRDYARNLDSEESIRRINPILNTVVELSYNHSEKERILYPEPENLLRSESVFKNEYFKVGHFQQNLTHSSYLTDMPNLFQNESGFFLLEKMYTAISEKIYQLNLGAEETTRTNLVNAKENLERILQNNPNQFPFFKQVIDNINSINNLILDLNRNDNDNIVTQLGESDIESKWLTKKYEPDYIFYPIQSGIENVTHKSFHKVFGTDVDNIFGMQRFETSKGWRFPFPPKRYNKITKGKHILIIDSGSLTGESLIQMIDSISFLEVGRIDVLSIVCRIEDFYREFYSRLKSLKVKHLKNINKTENEKYIQVIANANILFGINLHIPVFPSTVSCPFCVEKNQLENYLDKFKGKHLPPHTKQYIEQRLKKEINQFNSNSGDIYIYPKYLPTINGDPDFISIFLMRDKLGKIDSYRFYPQYFKEFDKLVECASKGLFEISNKHTLKEFELVLTCILHEPSLFGVHRDLLINVFKTTKDIISKLIFEKNITLDDFNYKWTKYSFVRLAHTYYGREIFDIDHIVPLFEFSIDDDCALNYLSFILWEGFFNLQKDRYIKEKTTSLLSRMSDELDNKDNSNSIYANHKIREIVKSIIHSFENTDVSNVNDAYFNLRKFFFTQSSDNTHSELKRIIFRITSIIENRDLSDDEINEIIDLSTNIRKTLKTSLLDNLIAIKIDTHLKKCDELQYNNLFKEDSVYNSMTNLISLQENIIAERKLIIELKKIDTLKLFVRELDKFQVDYLLEGKPFVNYCKKYKCDLKKCIDNALKSSKVKNEISTRKNFIIKEFSSYGIFVNGHSDLFIHAFEEIFYNAAHCTENDNVNIEFIINKSEERPIIELVIFQNKPFVPNGRINGIEKIILPIFKAFCGEDGIQILDKEKNSYQIKIRFNEYDLQNN
ncbi:MAG: hypothetical protein A2W85_18775 [Bacteroidetes bacterium GWF2_41_31]|nr:MAG: hypothetical protein A2W85_18775 [Bacteroidetes bacterium GWF2_41_31]